MPPYNIADWIVQLVEHFSLFSKVSDSNPPPYDFGLIEFTYF